MRLRFLSIVASAAAILGAAHLPSQTSAIAPRIVQGIDDSQLVMLKGNVTALAQPRFDRGQADPAMQMTSIRLVLSRSQEQEAALEQFMAQQLDKSSPNYHHWLTPQQFGTLYGPADSDIAAMVAWLESHGLQVQPVSPGRTNIEFSGSVSEIEAAFHTKIHSFNANGTEFYSNISNPQIPAALASVVSGVAGLNTLQPRSHAVRAPAGRYDPQLKRLVPLNASEAGARPDLTIGSTGSQTLYVVAADAATIYDTPNSLNANFSGGTSYTGQGVTIGIGGDGLIQAATVQDYRSKFVGDNAAPTITNVRNTATANGSTDEAYLDTEVAGGLAPGATIHFYTASQLSDAIDQALSDNTVDIFSLSFGQCELYLTTADNQAINDWWQQAAAQGIAVTVSAGDSGSAGCDDHDTALTASGGFQVSGFATTPYNIAVGGTDFYGLLSGFSTYVSSTNGNLYRSAKSYILEGTWNSSVQSDGTVSANVAYVNSSNKTNIDSGSGGVSSCSSNSTTYVGTQMNTGTCSGGYQKPTWQRGTGVPNDSHRDIPDVSLMAGAGSDYSAWLICTDDTYTQNGATLTTNCVTSNGSFSFNGSGGTSASAPAFAGILALVQQKMGGGGTANRLGLDGAKALYDLFNGPHAAAVFHDITQGNNSVPCTSGSPNCAQNTAGNYFMAGYDTGVGYDLATGLGSVDATQLVNYWGASTGSGSSTVTVAPASNTITTSQSLVVNITVAGSGTLGTPTGTVTLTSGTYTSGAVALTAGAASITVPAGSLAVGTDTLMVTYSGDSNYSSTTGTGTVAVTQAPKATPTVGVTAYSSAITTKQDELVHVTVAGTGGAIPTGSVTLTSGTYTSPAVTLVSGAIDITIPAFSLAVGRDALTVAYSGDSNFNSATGTAYVTVTTPTTPSVTVTPAATSIDSSQTLSVSVTVAGSGPPPSGDVTISGGGYTGTATALAPGAAGVAIITIPANSFSAGAVTLTASYVGDANYNAAIGTAQITVTQSVFSVSTGTPPPAISPGGTATETVTIGTSTSYSGTITLACAPGANNPSNQSGDAPSCTVSPSSISLGGTNGSSATATVSISTTAASAQMRKPVIGGWMAGGGTALALLVFFGIPARRRRWRTLLGMMALLIAFGGFSACGGGSSGGGGGNGSGGGGGTSNPGTVAGSYTFTVTGTGNPSISPSPTATINLTIN